MHPSHSNYSLPVTRYSPLLIIPAILEPELSRIQEKIKLVEPFVRRVQIDVADGKFVGNTTFLDLARLDSLKTKLHFDIHLMVENPKKYIEVLLKNKNKNVDRIFVHWESLSEKRREFLGMRRIALKAKKKLGLAVRPNTIVSNFAPAIGLFDSILFLTVSPGRQGNPFQERVLKRVSLFRKENLYVTIGVDGGINEKNIIRCKKAGANEFCVGSFLFSGAALPVGEKIKRLFENINSNGDL